MIGFLRFGKYVVQLKFFRIFDNFDTTMIFCQKWLWFSLCFTVITSSLFNFLYALVLKSLSNPASVQADFFSYALWDRKNHPCSDGHCFYFCISFLALFIIISVFNFHILMWFSCVDCRLIVQFPECFYTVCDFNLIWWKTFQIY